MKFVTSPPLLGIHRALGSYLGCLVDDLALTNRYLHFKGPRVLKGLGTLYRGAEAGDRYLNLLLFTVDDTDTGLL